MVNHFFAEGRVARMGRVGRVDTGLSLAIVAAFLAVACGGPVQNADKDEQLEKSQEALHTVPGKTWTAIGPAPITNGQQFVSTPGNPVTGGGHAVAPHPTDPNIIYFAGVNAGIWRTSNATATQPTWTPLTDFQPSLNMGAIALDRNNPNVVIAGTGRWSSLSNEGGSQGELLVSTNAGTSFSVITDPLFQGQKISGVVIRGSTLLVSNISSGVGLARSTNGGTTWSQISGAAGSGLPFGTVDDLIEDHQNANRLYVTMSGIGVFRSDNLGANWVNVSQNDSSSGGLNQVITTSFEAARMDTSNDGRAYVAVIQSGFVGLVAFTTNGGNTWTRMESPVVEARGNPFFHFAIGADPTSSNFVYIAGVSSWRRGDASRANEQWSDLAFGGTPGGTSPHPDVRDIEFDANGNYIEVGDGGIARRPTPRVSADWQGLAGNLQSVEFHEIGYDPSARIAFGGTQDNGTPMQATSGALAWDLFVGGDGGDVQTDLRTSPGNSIRYTSSQSLGGFSFTTFNAANTQIARVFPALAPTAGGQFLPQFYTPVELNRVTPTRIAFAMQDAVYESFDQGQTITSLGAAASAGELFYGHPSNPDVLYATAFGSVFRRLTAGGALQQTPANFPTFDARDVVLSNTSFQTAYVIGFQNVFVTNNAGSSWTDITGNLPSFQPGELRSLEFIPSQGHGLIVVGSNRGVFATATDQLGTWLEVGNLPNAPVLDMQYWPQQDLLIAGLLGRGAWSVTGLGGAVANQPPVALCHDIVVDAGNSCTAAVSSSAVDNGSFDPDGDTFTCVLVPAGPFRVGSTAVTLACTDSRGATGNCSAKVNVGVGDNPNCCPAGTNRIVGTNASQRLTGTAGNDCIVGLGGDDNIDGAGGDDFISGGSGRDTLVGGFGSDLITGGADDDTIDAGPGNDKVGGGSGRDTIAAGPGDDLVDGGADVDTCSAGGGNDVIMCEVL